MSSNKFGISHETVFKSIEEGRCRKAYAPYLPEPDYPNVLLSRLLAKCAYEYYLFNMKDYNYELCVKELLGRDTDVLKDLREYARFGKGKFWQYTQRGIYSEGALFINRDKGKPYEILHEMKLFAKEYKQYPNGLVETEVYFVVAISGIEYTICLSDPSIDGYKEWLDKNKGVSPLMEASEIQYPIGLADVNPMLIKR